MRREKRIGDGRMREPKEIFINGNTLEKILENHKHWLNKDVDEWKNMCANLSGTDLSGTDLSDANLNSVDLSGANLRYANLSGTDLSGADLRYVDLSGADLRYVDLSDAILSDIDLRSANLRGAYLDKEEQIRKGVKLSDSITGWKKCKDGVMCNDKRIYFAR